MRGLKRIIIIALALVSVAYIANRIYQSSSDRKEPPVISCPQEVLEVSARDNESALLAGVTASDPQDGNLTARIIVGGISKLISKDTARVTLLVFDNDHNMGRATRLIRYTDYQRPQFALNQPLVFSSAKDVSLLDRITATDVVDGDISKQVRVSTLASTDNSEVYDISIQVTNSMGDTSRLQLPVLVQETNPLRPVIGLNSYLVYLELGSSFDPAQYVDSLTVAGAELDVSAVSIDGTVDTQTADTYRVMYTHSANGSTGTAILTVVVQ